MMTHARPLRSCALQEIITSSYRRPASLPRPPQARRSTTAAISAVQHQQTRTCAPSRTSPRDTWQPTVGAGAVRLQGDNRTEVLELSGAMSCLASALCGLPTIKSLAVPQRGLGGREGWDFSITSPFSFRFKKNKKNNPP